jgi:uncharacterized membrane protein YphA (DoxX/SURF4 family)/phosphoheptose isomerase
MRTIITIIRTAIGWHFLYEGCSKLFAENWSSASYLNNTFGFLSGFYHWLAISPGRLAVVDFLNVWGLTLIGLALFCGLFVRWASLAGALLLALYYFAYPPFGFSLFAGDGSVYIINQVFIEASVLVFFVFYNKNGYGFDDAIQLLKKKKENKQPETIPVDSQTGLNTRREMLKNMAALPVLGLLGWSASRSAKLYGIDTLSGATIQINRVALGDLKGVLPKGKIGNHELTRLVAGGNLIGGWSHARDLIYTDSLFKAYNIEKKIFETLMLCEQAGINSINIGYVTMPTLVKYKKITGSKIKVIVHVAAQENSDDIFENIKTAIDSGMEILQIHGGQCDQLVRDNKIELIGKMLDEIRRQGYPAGLGAHDIHSFLACEENGIIPDYYMSTMHHDNYWSAHPRENRVKFETVGNNSPDRDMFHDNLFCPFPDLAVEFINRAKVPVMGFKVLAAGAIQPKDGFNWAFENGADFICVGMFDFQVVDDVNICIDTLQNLQNRTRAWYA